LGRARRGEERREERRDTQRNAEIRRGGREGKRGEERGEREEREERGERRSPGGDLFWMVFNVPSRIAVRLSTAGFFRVIMRRNARFSVSFMVIS